MAHKQLYRQCVMEKQIENGKRIHTAWIPTQFAKVGKKIGLKLEDESWDEGWTVTLAGSQPKEMEFLDQQRDAHKRWDSVLK